jgi:transposase InsO family protein
MKKFYDQPVQMEPLIIDGSWPAYRALIGQAHELRQQVFEFIEIYYNRVRRHSANGWVTPVEFERLYNQNLETSVVH